MTDGPSDVPTSPPPPSIAAASTPAISTLPVPSLPSRTYLSPPAPFTPPPLPVYAPNSIVPKFIRIVALVVFLIGGSVSAAVAWIYKTFVYPRLVLTLNALTELHRGDSVSYSKLLRSICQLALRPANQLISPKLTKQAEDIFEKEVALVAELVAEKDERTEESGVEPVVERIKPVIATPAPTSVDSIEPETEDSPPSIFEPLQRSLESLASLVSTSTAPNRLILANPAKWAGMSGSTGAERDLNQSLTTLTEYIEAESFASTSAAYRAYGVGTAVGVSNEQKTIYDAVSNFKTEIRALKGALLNRRNFTTVRAA